MNTPTSHSLTDPVAIPSQPILSEAVAGDFRRHFQKSSFQFSHNLAGHPAFSVDRIAERVKAQPENVHYDAGEIRVEQRWNEAPPQTRTVQETIEHIDNAEAWVFLKQAQKAPEYLKILETCLSEAESYHGAKFRAGMKQQEMIIFLTSPNRVTTYHIDRECSLLLQIAGSKTVYTFDGSDRSILPEEQIEKFWTVDNNAATYRPEIQPKARAFRLTPGVGIHIPVNHPHWVQNDDNVSISVNLNFQFPDRKIADIYRANYFLRKAGLHPAPAGRNPGVDSVKGTLFGIGRRILKPLAGSVR